MSKRGEILREVMSETGTTQSMLSRFSGVRQPSISQFLSGKVDLSDEQLDRLLSCMGYRLEVVRRPTVPELTHAERRSWRLHRQLVPHLDPVVLERWMPRLTTNLARESSSVRGEIHLRNVERWRSLIEARDLPALRRVMTGLGRDAIEMREVSPFGGFLPEDERLAILRDLRRTG